MDGISAARIEKIEAESQLPTPYDVVQMAAAYKRPDLCNYYCSHQCDIGNRYVPALTASELPAIIFNPYFKAAAVFKAINTSAPSRYTNNACCKCIKQRKHAILYAFVRLLHVKKEHVW